MRIGVPTPERGWKMDWTGGASAPAGREQLNPVAMRTNADRQRSLEARIAAHSARVDKDLRAGKKRRSFRGRRCPIVCLTQTDLATGGHPVFISATAAARSVGRYCDNVCQAIKRKGTCGGQRFEYLDELKGELIENSAGVKFFLPAKATPAPQPARPAAKLSPREQYASMPLTLFITRKPYELPAIAAHRAHQLPRLAHVPRVVQDIPGQMYLFAS